MPPGLCNTLWRWVRGFALVSVNSPAETKPSYTFVTIDLARYKASHALAYTFSRSATDYPQYVHCLESRAAAMSTSVDRLQRTTWWISATDMTTSSTASHARLSETQEGAEPFVTSFAVLVPALDSLPMQNCRRSADGTFARRNQQYLPEKLQSARWYSE